ncbi:hypothetical protein [Nakamurella leprariae]|uniref:Uncharacterized protein n=1 Tax=Nakamurella leprariae TaxID=2803911 RepID=A0A938YG37_9ACTN|nr:hypothetical protein [Nakamurella leprariae]MBM9468943.1 hypothetical protein [Nakamurella leprariae]
MTPAPWWLLTTSRAQACASTGAGVLWLAIPALMVLDPDWSFELVVCTVMGVAVIGLSVATLVSLRRRPEVRRTPLVSIPISRRGSDAWVVIRIAGWALVAASVVVFAVTLRGEGDPSWVSVPAAVVLLTVLNAGAQLRRPIVDGALEATRAPVSGHECPGPTR